MSADLLTSVAPGNAASNGRIRPVAKIIRSSSRPALMAVIAASAE